jgi:hypothetical protein
MPERFDIEFRVSEVKNKALCKFRDTTECITALLHSLDNYDFETNNPLKTHGFPFVIPRDIPLTKEERRQNCTDWIFRKAFEDIIVGITETLIEMYRCLYLYKLAADSKQKPVKSEEELFEEIKKINEAPKRMHLPVLIDRIQQLLASPVLLTKEILSVNKIRNCLVHRNTIVDKNDVDENGFLTLYYWDMDWFAIIEGQTHSITWQLKEKGFQPQSVYYNDVDRKLQFSEGMHVSFDVNVFNAVMYTCVLFVEQLYLMLPEEILSNQKLV